MKNSQIFKKIKADFADYATAQTACLNIYKYFCTISDKNNLKNLNFRKLKKEAQIEDDRAVYDAIIYFLGDRVNLLEVHFIFFDEEADEVYEIDYDVLLEATKSTKFYHPESEELVEDFANKIFKKYSISENGRTIT